MPINFITASASGSANISGTCTTAISISKGDTVIVVVKSDPSALLLGPIDTGGTTYNFLGGISNGSAELNVFGSPPGGAIASTSVSCSISPAFTDVVMIVARYSGVGAFGGAASTTGIAANPTITLATSAPNSVVLAGFGSDAGSVDTPLTGSLRQSLFFAGNANNVVSLVDSTSAMPASLTQAVTNAASNWAAVAVELLVAGPASEDFWLPPRPSPADPNITVW